MQQPSHEPALALIAALIQERATEHAQWEDHIERSANIEREWISLLEMRDILNNENEGLRQALRAERATAEWAGGECKRLEQLVANLRASCSEERENATEYERQANETYARLAQVEAELEASKAAHAATCEAWRNDKDFRAASAPKAPSVPRRDTPGIEVNV